MRCSNEYKALITKINNQKSNYAVKDLFVSTELEQKIQLITEKKKKWTVRLIVSTAIMLVLMGTIYDFLKIVNQKWIMTVVIVAMLVIFLVIFTFETVYKIKLTKLNKQKIKEDEEKNHVRNNIVSLNDQISSLAVSVIVLNEHFYELISIENEEVRVKKWQEYVLEVVEAINYKYSYRPTFEEYQEYYKNYEYFMKEKESLE